MRSNFRESYKSADMLRRQRNFRLSLIVTTIIVALVLIVFGINFEKIRIDTIEVNGARVLDENNIINLVNVLLNEKALIVLSKGSVLMVPTRKIESLLLKEFPRIRSIDVKRSGFTSIKIVIIERETNKLWCRTLDTSISLETVLSETTLQDRECYFIDDDGFVFVEAPNFSGSLFFEFYTQDELVEQRMVDIDVISSFMVPSEIIQEVQVLIEFLRTFGVNTLRVVEKSNDDLDVYTDADVRILITRKQSFELTLNNLESVLKSRAFKTGEESLKSALEKIEYIDLRFENKIYFK